MKHLNNMNRTNNTISLVEQKLALLVPLVCVLFAVPAEATMVKKMDMVEMSQATGQIFRGSVVDIEKGTVSAGGGDIPTITYRIKVTEQFKGTFPGSTNGELVLSITSVDLPVIDMPRLAVGEDYLLLTTTPSSVGLSTMVGLGQGTFKIYGKANAELAVNASNNMGLIDGVRGPMPYQDLANHIRSVLK